MTINTGTDTELFNQYEQGEKMQVRALAQKHTVDAVKTLVKLMKAPRTPAGVKRQCAMDILAQGWGRPDSRGDGGEQNKGGLTINILKLSTGMVEQVAVNNAEMHEIQSAVDVAEIIAAETDKTHE